MKGSSFYPVLVVILLVVSSGYAQKDIVVFTGVNSRNTFFSDKEPNFVDFYHNLAFNLGVGANFKADKFILLSPAIEVNMYPFPTGIYPYPYTFERNVESVDISKAFIYRFLLEFKIISSDKYSEQAYLLTGIGYSIEDFNIKVNWGMINETEKVNYENTNYFVHTFGAGIIFSLNEKYAINIEGKFLTDYEKFDNSLNVGFMFKKIDLGKILFWQLFIV